MNLSKEEIAIELSDRIKEDWNWQIKPQVIERENTSTLEVTCGTAVHTDEFHEYVERRILDLPVKKNGMSGSGIIIHTGDSLNDDNMIVLSRYHGGYDPEPDEEVIYP